MQEFTAPLNTNYKIECWGAQGGVPTIDKEMILDIGMGGYTCGNINLSKNLVLYLYLGQSTFSDRGMLYNGGGMGKAPGGGATDVRLVNGSWNSFESQKSRIMVAGGGGGGFYNSLVTNREPGHAGGVSGISANCIYSDPDHPNRPSSGYSGEGGLQTRGGRCGTNAEDGSSLTNGDGRFGSGGFGTKKVGDIYAQRASGGGGGYYGGGHGVHPGNSWTGGGGGSSFISGYPGCDAIDESSTEDNIVHTGQPNHYSGKVFTNSVMVAGNAVMPKPKGGTEIGHEGNGYCIITWQQLP